LQLRRAPSLARVLGGHPRGPHLTPTLEAREYRDRDLELREDRLTRELEGEDIVLGDDRGLVLGGEPVNRRAIPRIPGERLRQPRGDVAHELARLPRGLHAAPRLPDEVLGRADLAGEARPPHREGKRRKESAPRCPTRRV